jgi:predicted AlkP superfamily pyrophosphatase or phosphodiesterase
MIKLLEFLTVAVLMIRGCKKRLILLLVLSFNSFAKTPLVLLSIDGFSHRYLEQYQPKTLNALIKQGTSAKALIPVYPSKTFPNHLSIVTGVYPINHGIVHNDFYNRTIAKEYSLGAGKYDSRWLTAKPIWHINEEQGNKSAVYFWPESETKITNKQVSHVEVYDHFRPNKQRLDKILSWLRLPEKERPNFIASYFASVDDAGHDYGSGSAELKQAISQLDKLLGEFVETINNEFSGNVNLVIVSDHGMTPINKSHVIEWKDIISNDVRIINGSTQLYIYSDNQQKLNDTRSQLLAWPKDKGQQGYQVYQYPNYPKHWHFNKKTTATPDIIVDAQPSYIFSKGHKQIDPETHGYDPFGQPDLNAIFIATGPSFKAEKIVKAFENVHVLPILTRALGLEDVQNIDGSYTIAHEIVDKDH